MGMIVFVCEYVLEMSFRYNTICNLVHDIDPASRTLHVHDSGTDVKIYIKSKLSGRIFNKGHGIQLLAENLHLDLAQGNTLMCGDSETDLPMLMVGELDCRRLYMGLIMRRSACYTIPIICTPSG